jgi:hypothetical protein
MTHEYVIALNGRVEPNPSGHRATAVGWAAQAVLAVDTDEIVRAISRGDSTFLDLGGCTVTPLPTDPVRAATMVEASRSVAGIARLLVDGGLLDPDARLEPGSPADLAFWRDGHLVAMVRDGHFTAGDDHRGPFPDPG